MYPWKLIFVIIISFCSGHWLFSQCETWNQSPRADEAQEAHVLYRQFIRGKNADDLARLSASEFNSVFNNWKKAYEIAPAADGKRAHHFSDGRILYQALIRKSDVEAEQKEYTRIILKLYDEQMQCHNSKAYLLGRKAFDMFFSPFYGYRMETFKAFKTAIAKGGNNSEYILIEPMAQLAVYLSNEGSISYSEANSVKTSLTHIADHNVERNQRYSSYYKSAKERMETHFQGLKKMEIVNRETKKPEEGKINKTEDEPIPDRQSDVLDRKGKDFALFLAIDQYDEWADLRNPINDSKTIAKELEEEYGFQTEVIENPSQVEILEKINAYLSKSFPDDGQLFIFFSGHGEFREDSKEGFFIPHDGKQDDPVQISYLTHTRLSDMINNIPCSHILVAIDACYSGTFDKAIARSKGRPGETSMTQTRNFATRRLKHKSRLYLTSGGKERTPDGIDHSPFTKQLLQGLRSYGREDGILTFNELLTFMDLAFPTPRFGQFGDHEGSGFLFFVKGLSKK